MITTGKAGACRSLIGIRRPARIASLFAAKSLLLVAGSAPALLPSGPAPFSA